MIIQIDYEVIYEGDTETEYYCTSGAENTWVVLNKTVASPYEIGYQIVSYSGIDYIQDKQIIYIDEEGYKVSIYMYYDHSTESFVNDSKVRMKNYSDYYEYEWDSTLNDGAGDWKLIHFAH